MSELKTAPRHAAGRPPRKRRWLRWAAVAVAALVVLIVLAAWAFIKFGPTAAPLALPAGPASAPSGPLDGSWTVAAGSIPVTFSAWHIKGPGGFGFLGSLADHGTAEFLLTLNREGP